MESLPDYPDERNFNPHDGNLNRLAEALTKARARIHELEADLAEEQALRQRLDDLLRRTAVALRGPEPPGTPDVAYDWSAIPDWVTQLSAALTQALNGWERAVIIRAGHEAQRIVELRALLQ